MSHQANSSASKVAIALGSNLGDSIAILEAAIKALERMPGIEIIIVSSWYQTKAIGPPQPNYINGCVSVRTEQKPHSLLQILLGIEKKFGRIRREKWGPRTLDLDLLLYDDLILETPTLQIPHPRIRERAFVLAPLAEIEPSWIEPVSGKSIKELLKAVDCTGVNLLSNR
ncbi:2-amino-4-hydroxy-6-hydroxymethyldihydropteridine diphosphokinase [Mastigocoleus sp. MO_188.B34]|uniref:2-amino-4-hydroxy-6- hydroxymethyldihydropteridine diphosphokinase n=1 Tax=Mastigocoleus sp. MO_188.B34 TaxID=3036635 RepID=UPI00260342A3|nr:2-amino-4-hydroxy-6-hydroxymethyldihydropteridine diphosphokinase [Mastigocoleus sp. MO_188.B34]MDJ0695738.1 2-amino-4-hydroxy-6-hydroxymethyldihydropteridine diphosphokinase [Mastigocoleus sp. MO_188.B34]